MHNDTVVQHILYPYTGSLHLETLGDSKNTFLRWGDDLDVHWQQSQQAHAMYLST